MKTLHTMLIAGTALSLYLVGCSTPQGTREDYFGYNNKPVIEEEKETGGAQVQSPQEEAPPPQTKRWRNPMSETPPDIVYVPVTVPLWDRYYGWEDYHHTHVVVLYPHHRSYPHYGWEYAYGYPYYYDYPQYRRPYDNYPYYPVANTEEPEKKKTTRRIGSSRGSMNEETAKDSRGSDNSGVKIRGRGETSTNSNGTGELVSTPVNTPANSTRSVKVVSRGGETKKTESTPDIKSRSTVSTSKKSDGETSKDSNSKKSTTEKQDKATVRGRGE